MAITKEDLIRKLNEHCFRTIWNEIRAECRVNIELKVVNQRFVKSSVQSGFRVIYLPTSEDLYLVLSAPIALFSNGLNLPSEEWVNGEDVVHRYKTLTYLYQRPGKVIPRRYTYFKILENGRVLIAINKNAVVKIFGYGPYDPTYVTVYRDSDQVNDIHVRSWFINPLNPTASSVGIMDHINQCKALNFAGTQVLINGAEVDHSRPIIWNGGDYVEVVFDENVVGSYTITVSDATTGYFSSKDQKYREILHCPKSLNPDNKLITHNTCTLTVRNPHTGEGRYLHRTDDTSVGQITHNDLSVDSDVIKAHREYLGSEELDVVVRVRTHGKDNVLFMELSYIFYLYTLDDAMIIRHLKGELDSSLSFWKASELEKSVYVKMMFDTPNTLDHSLLDMYVEGLGYYTVASLLSGHISHHVITHPDMRYVVAEKPFALTGVPVVPMVYVRGRKIRSERITYHQIASNKVGISISPDVYLPKGSVVTVSLVERGSARPYRFTPSVTTPTITVPYSDVTVYEIVPLEEPVQGLLMQSNVAYRELTPSPGTLAVYPRDDGSIEVVFGISLYGRTILIQNGNFSLHDTIPVDDHILNRKGAIVIPLETTTAGDVADALPLHGHTALEIYANGRALVPGLDFTAIPKSTYTGHPAFTEIVITNMSYFSSEPGNVVDVVAHTGHIVSEEPGYMFNNLVSYDDNLNLWYDGISRGFANGLLLHKPEDMGTYLQPTETIGNGSPYYLVTTLPSSISKALAGYTPGQDNARLRAINRYFNRVTEVDTSFIIIEKSHKLYSPWLAEIIKDILTNRITVSNDPSNEMFLKQFSSYDYLKERDPAITKTAGVVDFRYVDVNPTYISWTVDTALMHTIIHRLVKLTLNDPLSLGDVYDG